MLPAARRSLASRWWAARVTTQKHPILINVDSFGRTWTNGSTELCEECIAGLCRVRVGLLFEACHVKGLLWEEGAWTGCDVATEYRAIYSASASSNTTTMSPLSSGPMAWPK